MHLSLNLSVLYIQEILRQALPQLGKVVPIFHKSQHLKKYEDQRLSDMFAYVGPSSSNKGQVTNLFCDCLMCEPETIKFNVITAPASPFILIYLEL